MTERVFYGNEPGNYAIALGTLVVLVLAVMGLARYGPITQALRRRRETERASALDRYLLRLIETTFVPLAYVAALFAAISTLHLDHTARHFLRQIGIGVAAWALVRVGIGMFRFSIEASIARGVERGLSSGNLRSFVPFVTIIAWGFAIVFVLDEWGFHVSAIVAGLGIGGAAVALAAQSILRDWFGYVALVSDRPFEIGHFVQVGTDYIGTVDAMGVRSIRMRSLSGEEVTIPNNDVATARLRNYTRMQERRILFTFTVSHATPAERLRVLPDLVRAAIEAQGLVRFDRSHWLSFTDAGFVFENVYFVLSPEYNLYMDVQHAVNIAIVEAMREREIELAGPPMTVTVTSGAPSA
ncbi:MAG: mechanosensitive ion channel family protein [Vulcanimicrobiaceae bacterium]